MHAVLSSLYMKWFHALREHGHHIDGAGRVGTAIGDANLVNSRVFDFHGPRRIGYLKLQIGQGNDVRLKDLRVFHCWTLFSRVLFTNGAVFLENRAGQSPHGFDYRQILPRLRARGDALPSPSATDALPPTADG